MVLFLVLGERFPLHLLVGGSQGRRLLRALPDAVTFSLTGAILQGTGGISLGV